VPRYSACISVQHGDELTPKSLSEGSGIPVFVQDSTLVTLRSGSYPKPDQVEEQVIGTVTVTVSGGSIWVLAARCVVCVRADGPV
jgi:hypothetical protein